MIRILNTLVLVAVGALLAFGVQAAGRGSVTAATARSVPAYCNADTYTAVLPGLERVADEVDYSHNLEVNVGLRDRHLRGASVDFAKDAALYQSAVDFITARLRECVR